MEEILLGVLGSLDLCKKYRRSDVTVLFSQLIKAYNEAGQLEDAREIFDKARTRNLANVVTYSTMIDGYSKACRPDEARKIFDEAREKKLVNAVTYNTMVDAYCKAGLPDKARKIFDEAFTRNLANASTYNAMIDAYGKAHRPDGARKVFDEAREEKLVNAVTYNTMIGAYGKAGLPDEARKIFDEAREKKLVDAITYNSMIDAYSKANRLAEVEEIFKKACKDKKLVNVVTYGTMIDAYGKAGRFVEAEEIFDDLCRKDLANVVTYNAMIAACGKADRLAQAEEIFKKACEGEKPLADSFTYNTMIAVYGARLPDEAHEIFDKARTRKLANVVTYSTIIGAYGKAGLPHEAREIFNEALEQKLVDAITYNSMIAAYGKAGLPHEARRIFDEACKEGLADIVTYSTMIDAYGAGLLNKAREIFDEGRKKGLTGVVSYNTMIDAYCKGGRLAEAQEKFDGACKAGLADVFTYSTMIDAYGKAGLPDKAREMFDKKECKKLANTVTYNAMIDAYGKAGLPDDAREIFDKKECKKLANAVTYATMIDAYAKAGLPYEAREIFDPACRKGLADGCTYATMIDAYGKAGLPDQAREIFDQACRKDLADTVTYNTLIDVYGRHSLWKEAQAVFNLAPARLVNTHMYSCYLNRLLLNPPPIVELIKIAVPLIEGLLSQGAAMRPTIKVRWFDCLRRNGLIDEVDKYIRAFSNLTTGRQIQASRSTLPTTQTLLDLLRTVQDRETTINGVESAEEPTFGIESQSLATESIDTIETEPSSFNPGSNTGVSGQSDPRPGRGRPTLRPALLVSAPSMENGDWKIEPNRLLRQQMLVVDGHDFGKRELTFNHVEWGNFCRGEAFHVLYTDYQVTIRLRRPETAPTPPKPWHTSEDMQSREVIDGEAALQPQSQEEYERILTKINNLANTVVPEYPSVIGRFSKGINYNSEKLNKECQLPPSANITQNLRDALQTLMAQERWQEQLTYRERHTLHRLVDGGWKQKLLIDSYGASKCQIVSVFLRVLQVARAVEQPLLIVCEKSEIERWQSGLMAMGHAQRSIAVLSGKGGQVLPEEKRVALVSIDSLKQGVGIKNYQETFQGWGDRYAGIVINATWAHQGITDKMIVSKTLAQIFRRAEKMLLPVGTTFDPRAVDSLSSFLECGYGEKHYTFNTQLTPGKLGQLARSMANRLLAHRPLDGHLRVRDRVVRDGALRAQHVQPDLDALGAHEKMVIYVQKLEERASLMAYVREQKKNALIVGYDYRVHANRRRQIDLRFNQHANQAVLITTIGIGCRASLLEGVRRVVFWGAAGAEEMQLGIGRVLTEGPHDDQAEPVIVTRYHVDAQSNTADDFVRRANFVETLTSGVVRSEEPAAPPTSTGLQTARPPARRESPARVMVGSSAPVVRNQVNTQPYELPERFTTPEGLTLFPNGPAVLQTEIDGALKIMLSTIESSISESDYPSGMAAYFCRLLGLDMHVHLKKTNTPQKIRALFADEMSAKNLEKYMTVYRLYERETLSSGRNERQEALTFKKQMANLEAMPSTAKSYLNRLIARNSAGEAVIDTNSPNFMLDVLSRAMNRRIVVYEYDPSDAATGLQKKQEYQSTSRPPSETVHWLVYGGRFIALTEQAPVLSSERFYVERQEGHLCAIHAANAMFGEKVFSVKDFAIHELGLRGRLLAERDDVDDSLLSPAIENIRDHGLMFETTVAVLNAWLQGNGRDVVRQLVYMPGQERDFESQARELDGLQADRMMLQVDRQGEQIVSASSHYVAFRKDHRNRWVLLDSESPGRQPVCKPSDYINECDGNNFSAIY